jgi:tetratricopeptide (TPR) repeat protein
MTPVLYGFPPNTAAQIQYRIREDRLYTKQISNALIVPAVPDPDKGSFLHGVHGGVLDEHAQFVQQSAQWRDVEDLCVFLPRGYNAKTQLRDRSAYGIYAGVIFDHYGHFILESLSRLWYALEDKEKRDWPIYFLAHGLPLRPYQIEIFKLLEIYDRIRIVTLPTEVGTLLLPESSIRYQRTAHIKFRRVFHNLKAASPAAAAPKDKIYISRLDVSSAVSVPEQAVEEIFRSDGWDIIHPETMTVAEQISLFKNSRRVAGLTGSGMHNVLYSECLEQVININRFPKVLDSFFLLDDLFKIPACYIHAYTETGFPPFDAAGPFFLDVGSVHKHLVQQGLVSKRTLSPGFSTHGPDDFSLYEAYWHHKRSEYLNFSGRSQEGLMSIQAALHLRPKLGLFHLQHSACLHALGDRVAATDAAEQALHNGYRTREAYRHLIELLLLQERTSEAHNWADMAVESRPKDPVLLALQGRIRFYTVGREDGINILKRAVALGPDNPDVIYQYALCLFEASSLVLALKSIDAAILIVRGNSDYRMLRSKILLSSGNSEEALKEAHNAADLNAASAAAAAWLFEVRATHCSDSGDRSGGPADPSDISSQAEEVSGLSGENRSAANISSTLPERGPDDKDAQHFGALGEGISELTDSFASNLRMLDITPDYEHKGVSYDVVLGWLHQHLRPKSYLEVGSFSGGSLALADCPTIAVDPNFQIQSNVIGRKPSLMLFQAGSDDFFQQRDPRSLFGRNIDLAFLDGMHLFEFLLRDFINTERFCSSNSIIALHDCLPLDAPMTVREGLAAPNPKSRFSDWWTGDVWKVVSILRSMRPEIKILCLDAPPTGLVLCTNLSPGSEILSKNYFDLVEHWRGIEIENYGVERFLRECGIVSTDSVSSFHKLSSYFWF